MKKSILTIALSAMILTTSCSTSEQFYGAMTGASLGGLFGSAIGGISDGRRGSDVGTLVGMAIGGALGAAATTPKNDNNRTSDYYNGYGKDDYYQNNSNSPYSNIVIEDIRFFDSNGNNSIDAGERAKLSFIVRNVGNVYMYDLAPVITVSGTKHIYLSPTAIISGLAPGKAVRYQAEVFATDKLKTGNAGFSIGMSDGNRLYTIDSFSIRTYHR